jgi:UDP-glucose 4-epimerase
MKVLVTGGAGFIGSNICAALLEAGDEVRIVDDLSSGHRSNLDALDGVELLVGDVRDPELMNRAARGCEVVFHLAASVGNKRSIDNPVEDAEINAMGAVRTLEAARAAGVRKVVVSSSAGIYGELKTLPIGEDHPLEPLTPYGVSKLFAEKQALAYAHVYGLEAICLRYFNVYGPNQRFDAYGNVIPIFAFNALEGRPIQIYGDGHQTRDFVNVADVVQANLSAARNHGVTGAFNIASGTQLKIGELARRVAAFVPREVSIEHGDIRPGDVAHSLADISAARAAFGYEPGLDIEPGLEVYMAWAAEEVARRGS